MGLTEARVFFGPPLSTRSTTNFASFATNFANFAVKNRFKSRKDAKLATKFAEIQND